MVTSVTRPARRAKSNGAPVISAACCENQPDPAEDAEDAEDTEDAAMAVATVAVARLRVERLKR